MSILFSNLQAESEKQKRAINKQGPGFLKKKQKTERPVRAERPDGDERPVRVVKREVRRHSFEFYRDQLDQLENLKIKYMKAGELKSKSAMVREALDEYLSKQG